MALFHLNVSSIGKASSSSACASAAYRSCSQITQTVMDSQTGIEVSYTHDFSNKKGLAFSEIFAPEGVDSWCLNREQLWNKVEQRETHIKGRYARDIKLALQTEFTLDQNIQILSEYVKDTFVKDGIIADVNIHMDDSNNPHAHIMLTTRKLEIDANGEWIFGNKNRLLDSKGWLVNIRNNWAEINNKYFMIHDIDKTITHESYEARGLGFIKSTIHEGASKHTEDKDYILERPEYNREIVNENLQYIKSNPSEVIQALAHNASKTQGAFGRVDLYKAIDVLLNEIATRGNEAQILVDEARTSLLSKCEEIFHEVNQYDLTIDLDGYDGVIRYADGHNNYENNSHNDNNSNLSEINAAPTNIFPSTKIQENVIAIIERFFERDEQKVNINDELEYIKQNSAKLIEEISRVSAVFSKKDLAKALDTHINKTILEGIEDGVVDQNINHKLLAAAKEAILKEYDGLLSGLISSNEIVKLIDSDLGGKEVYTTKSQLALEKEFTSNIDKLSESNHHSLNLPKLSEEEPSVSKRITNGINNRLAKLLTPDATAWLEKTLQSLIGGSKAITLTDEQTNAVLSLVNGKDLVVLSGMPGTGKSTVMAKLVDEYTNHGYEVVGGATSAIAALNLGTEANIKSYTLSKWKYDWDNRSQLEKDGEVIRNLLPNLTNRNVMIVDEMSMVDLKMFSYITSKVVEAGAKLIVLGDNNQFSAIGIGGASEKVVDRAENVVLTELFRQRSNLDKEITRKLSSYKVDEAITLLDRDGRIKIGNSPELTRSELVNQYMTHLHSLNGAKGSAKNNETNVIIAYRNSEVQALNLEIRNRMLNSGLLLTKKFGQGGQDFNGNKSILKIAINEQLVFTKNQRYLGVLNGQIGRVVEILDNSRFKVELLDGANKKPRIVLIDNKKFDQFDYGYAITSYKSQGKTYDHSYLLIDSSVGYESFNVMATRHRASSVFYIDRGVLNDIVSRKFDHDKEVHHQNNKLAGNENAALFELLSRRSSNILAEDYKDYDQKAEVIQIKAYIECRDKASSVYRQMLQWQETMLHQDQKVELWDNNELWSEFNSLREERSQHAQELVEGYSVYRKYISSSVVNYATLLKHADAATLEFDYLSSAKLQILYKTEPDHYKVSNENYNDLKSDIDTYLKNPSKNKSDKLLGKVEELLAIQQEHKCNLARLSNHIHNLENEKWDLESQRKSNIHYREDVKNFLNQTYQQGSQVALANWHELKQSMGIKNALEHIKNNPESIGSLAGVGWSDKIAVSKARSRAVFNLTSLGNRLEFYEKTITKEQELNGVISQKETIELKTLKTTYNQMEANKPLNPMQEKYLYGLHEHKSDLHTWIKDNNREVIAKASNKLGLDSLAKSTAVSDKHYNIKADLTYSEIHEKLSANVVALSQQLLPSISNKKIEIDKHAIKCGSLSIELEGNKRGLWYRFSRTDEKGDLFDLIRVSQGLSNKQSAIEWGKSYLGLDKDNHFINKSQSNKIANKEADSSVRNKEMETTKIRQSLKVLSPVPHDAAVFKPEMVFKKQLQNKEGNNKVIGGIYAYKNIKNKLCGYVVRIKDIANNTKVTLPVVYTENNHGIKSWRSKSLGEDRCLYNEHLLKDSNKPVLIVEGEKTADIAQSLYPEFDVVTWSGGANGFNKSNWDVLKDKQVSIWPDNDRAGIDAARKIQVLLETKDITKAKVVDLDKIDYLPKKWDLADSVPEKVWQHQITGALYAAKGIETNVRISKTIADYLEHRQNSLNIDLIDMSTESFSKYMIEKEKIKYKLHYETVLSKEILKTKDIISVKDEVTISSEASKLVDNHIKSLHLSPDTKIESIADHIQHDLEQLHINTPKAVLTEVTNAALRHSEQVINEHNKRCQINEVGDHTNKVDVVKTYSLTKADLPILALSLSSNILNQHQNADNKQIHIIQHDSQEHLQQKNLQHSINIAVSCFKARIAQGSMNFERHQQQQVLQRQMIQHQGMEM